VAPALLQRLTPQLRARIDRLVDKLLDGFAEAGKLEVVSELAYPVPLAVLSDLFGIPKSLRDRVGRNVLKLSKLFSPIVSPTDKADADQAIELLKDCLSPIFDRRFEQPEDDVISDLAGATAKGLLSRSEAIDNTIFLIFAGLETSMSLITTGCVALVNHPEQRIRLRTNPACVPTAIDEFLRYDAPTQITARVVQIPLELAGRKLSKGRVLLLLLGSANHDERQFHQPERLNVERHPNPHLSFGAGAHYCLGAALAKIESEVIFSRLPQRFSEFEFAGDVVRESCATPRIYLNVPIRVEAATDRSLSG
jgi:cytochrome P450